MKTTSNVDELKRLKNKFLINIFLGLGILLYTLYNIATMATKTSIDLKFTVAQEYTQLYVLCIYIYIIYNNTIVYIRSTQKQYLLI